MDGPGTEASKDAAVRAMTEAWKGNFDLIADDYVDHNMAAGLPPGRDGFALLYQLSMGAFPDLTVSIDHAVAEGDLVAMRLTNRATNTGSFMGNEPTGKTAEWTTMALFRVADGKMAERWGVVDLVGLYRQLGLKPAL